MLDSDSRSVLPIYAGYEIQCSLQTINGNFNISTDSIHGRLLGDQMANFVAKKSQDSAELQMGVDVAATA